MSDNSITIRGLCKNYGEVRALDGIDLEIPGGEIFGILGPNGSGKTTLLKIISSIMEPTSGLVSVNGINVMADPMKVKSIIGYVPETPNLYESLTPIEFLGFVGSIRKIDHEILTERIYRFAKAFEIEDNLNNFIGSLSFGTKQKVAIISAFIHDPDIVILDEGMNGLDPRSAKILKNLLLEYVSSGRTVLFSTHVLEVAESVCHRMAIIYKGRIMDVGTLKELRDSAGRHDANLEDIFLKATGDSDLKPVIDSLRETMNR
ncbi:MAG: ABC transporter ATP-binding protein [Candidatus Thermoplasmatota archaeon]|jgi:ABC-2 type transport system ATP-binding protein|nr:ABC transporter ATP-binding protein [Candidatus Thermoplasmatota archaeon]